MNCQKGDLAVIVSIQGNENHVSDSPLLRNIGAFVDVLEFLHSVDDDVPGWLCKSKSPMTAQFMLFGRAITVETPPGDIGWVADRCLRPIRPPGVPEDTSTQAPKEHAFS